MDNDDVGNDDDSDGDDDANMIYAIGRFNEAGLLE